MNLKKICLAFFAVITTVAVTVFATSQASSHLTLAEECEHEGNHYTKLAPTTSSSGTQEYWVCCKCHKHFLENVGGTWNDNGQASIIDDNTDDRYLYPLNHTYTPEETDDIIAKCNAISLTAAYKNGGVEIGQYKGTASTVIIPEGVTSIGTSCFRNKQTVKKIVIPSTVTDDKINRNAFSTLRGLELFFVNDTKYTATSMNVSGLYKILNTGWEYIDGEPFAK